MFKIGGEVEVIKSHSQGFVKKGQRYIVKDIMELSCGHGIVLDLGLRDSDHCISRCKCGFHFFSGDINWISSKILSPIDDDFATQTLDRILEEVKKEEKIKILEPELI